MGLDDGPRCLDDRLAQSQTIHSFLCGHLGHDRAHFNYAFDLPLLALADNPEWRRELLQGAEDSVEPDDLDDQEDRPW